MAADTQTFDRTTNTTDRSNTTDRTNTTDRRHYLDRLDAEANRAILMVGAGAVGSVVLMYLIEKIF